MTVDRTQSNVWLHVTVRNRGSTTASWWPIPYVSLGGRRIGADYAGSSRFGQDLAPGAGESGWLKFGGVPPNRVQGRSFRVVFPQVASDGYRQVRDVALTVAPTASTAGAAPGAG